MMYNLNLESAMSPVVVWMNNAFFLATVILIIAVAATFFTIAVAGDAMITKVIICFTFVIVLFWGVIFVVAPVGRNAAEKKAVEEVFQSIGAVDDWDAYKETVVIDGTEYAYTIDNRNVFSIGNSMLLMTEAN